MFLKFHNKFVVVGGCQEKNCPPENFYPRTKFFSDYVENFCPALKIFVRLTRPCLAAFSVLLRCMSMFSMLYSLFHHAPIG